MKENHFTAFARQENETQQRIFNAVAVILSQAGRALSADTVAQSLQSILTQQGSMRRIHPVQMIPMLNSLVALGRAKLVETPHDQPQLWVAV